jgi:hypothetical protein
MARPGRRRERDSFSLVLALLLHGLALFAVRTWGTGSAGAVAVPLARLDDTVEIDISDLAAGPDVAAPAPERTAPGIGTMPQASVAAGTRSAVKRAAPKSGEPADSAPEVVALADEAPSPDAAATGTPAHQGPIDLGIGPDGWQRWVGVLPSEPVGASGPRGRPVVRAPPVSSTGGLQEGLEAHDRALGIGPAGRVASALFKAAHAPDAPETGVALFNVTVLKSGAVEVSLGDSTDRRWQAVAQHAAEALRQAPPRIPPPREGYRLTLRITAEETMPNGLKRKDLHGARLEATPLRFTDQKTAEREAELKNPTAGVGPDRQEFRGSPINMELPGVYVTGTGKTCSYRIGISPLGLLLQGGCDPVNAGAKLQRIVRTEVREQTAF